jgi:hypothetical protein
MAIDGLKILESDFGIDIQNEILDLYDTQKSEQEIKLHLKSEWQKLTEPLDIEIFITSGCLTLWEIGMLDDDFLMQLKTLVEKGADKFWLVNFDSITLENRNSVLRQLLIKVKEPNTKIRKRKAYKGLLNNLFTKGEVLVILIDSLYHCIIFEDFYQHKSEAYYSFVATTYNKSDISTIDELLVEEIPVIKTKSGELGVRKLDIYYKDIEKFKSDFVKIGIIKLNQHAESLGFARQVSIDNISGLKDQIEDILLGNKAELYEFYSI